MKPGLQTARHEIELVVADGPGTRNIVYTTCNTIGRGDQFEHSTIDDLMKEIAKITSPDGNRLRDVVNIVSMDYRIVELLDAEEGDIRVPVESLHAEALVYVIGRDHGDMTMESVLEELRIDFNLRINNPHPRDLRLPYYRIGKYESVRRSDVIARQFLSERSDPRYPDTVVIPLSLYATNAEESALLHREYQTQFEAVFIPQPE